MWLLSTFLVTSELPDTPIERPKRRSVILRSQLSPHQHSQCGLDFADIEAFSYFKLLLLS